MVLDTVGVILANWKTAELDSAFKQVHDFQVLKDKAYFFLPAFEKIFVFRIESFDPSAFRQGRH